MVFDFSARPWRAHRAAFAAAALLSATLAGAQAPPPDTPASTQAVLRAAFDAAWARQPEQRALAWRRDAARASAEAAQRWLPESPTLELSARGDRFDDNAGTREYEAALSMPLWRAGERGHAAARAEAGRDAAEAQAEAARWRLAGELREAFWAWQRAWQDTQLSAARLASAQGVQRDVARRVAAGDLARADDHQARATVAAAEAAQADAAVALAQADARWAALTQGPAPAPLTQPEPTPASGADMHAELRDLEAQAALAQREADLAASQRRAPLELTLAGTRERDAFGSRYANTLRVGVRVPLGRTAEAPVRAATAAAERAEAETRLARARDRLAADQRAAVARLQALDVAHAAAEQRARLAGELRGFVEKAFRLGESDLATRLRAELEATEAERQLARSALERAAALSSRRQALGLLFD